MLFRFLLATLLTALMACQTARESKPVHAAPVALTQSIDQLYEAFCFDAEGQADWQTMRDLFAPGAAFVAPFAPGDSPKAVDEDTFLADFKAWVESDTMRATGLHERIVHVEIEHLGVIAHTWITFEGFYPETGEVRSVGVDSIQWVLDGERWLLASFTTQYEGDALQLPVRFWPER